MFLKHDGISDQTPVVPGVEYSFSVVVGHHGVVAELTGELNIGFHHFPVLVSYAKLMVMWTLDSIAVNTINHFTGHKPISR